MIDHFNVIVQIVADYCPIKIEKRFMSLEFIIESLFFLSLIY
jgi:hypothetical protein